MLNANLIKRAGLLFTIALLVTGLLVSYCYVRDYHRQSKHMLLVERAIIKPVKVFQIGFSKCGTVTLAVFFSKNGIRTIHHDQGWLARTMYANYLDGKELLEPEYQHYTVYTDMENMVNDPPLKVGMLMFRELDKQYPGSKFILNIRDKQKWLQSRALHPINDQNSTNILEANAKILHITEQEVLAQWAKEWDDHHKAVIEYFKDRPNDLLVFDIEKDSAQKLKDFFKDYFVLDLDHYQQRNITSVRFALKAKNEQENIRNAGKKETLLGKAWHKLSDALQIIRG